MREKEQEISMKRGFSTVACMDTSPEEILAACGKYE